LTEVFEKSDCTSVPLSKAGIEPFDHQVEEVFDHQEFTVVVKALGKSIKRFDCPKSSLATALGKSLLDEPLLILG
jgi:hypothetical protein